MTPNPKDDPFTSDLNALELAVLMALQTVDAATEHIDSDESWPGTTRVKLEAIEHQLDVARFYAPEVRATVEELRRAITRIRKQRDILIQFLSTKRSDLFDNLTPEDIKLVVWLITAMRSEPMGTRNFDLDHLVRTLIYFQKRSDLTDE